MKLVIQYVAFALIGALVYGSCRLLRLKPVSPDVPKPRRSALCALVSVLASMLIITMIMLANQKHALPQHAPPHGTGHKHPRHLTDQMSLLAIYFLPMALMLRLNGEKLRSIGLARANLLKATLVGLVVAALTVFFGRGGPRAVFVFNESRNLHSLVYYAFVGFGEEILFRGYLQSRLVAWRGLTQGWILASVVMALVHVPQRLFIQHLGVSHALVSSLGLIPVSLLMGYIMLKTGSVVPSGLFHTFGDWVECD